MQDRRLLTHTEPPFSFDPPTPSNHADDAWADELWALADATVSELFLPSQEDASILPPLFPLEPMPKITKSPPLQKEDPVAILRIACDMATSGKRIEAKRLRREAMLLIQALT